MVHILKGIQAGLKMKHKGIISNFEQYMDGTYEATYENPSLTIQVENNKIVSIDIIKPISQSDLKSTLMDMTRDINNHKNLPL